ncbi:MAG: hypothetical protein ABSC65_23970 [Acidobacteriaceae bacterium]
MRQLLRAWPLPFGTPGRRWTDKSRIGGRYLCNSTRNKAMTIGGQILASHGQYTSQATQVTINMQKEWWEHQQRMRELSLKVTESINRVKP